jgi:hypothetical protein
MWYNFRRCGPSHLEFHILTNIQQCCAVITNILYNLWPRQSPYFSNLWVGSIKQELTHGRNKWFRLGKAKQILILRHIFVIIYFFGLEDGGLGVGSWLRKCSGEA